MGRWYFNSGRREELTEKERNAAERNVSRDRASGRGERKRERERKRGRRGDPVESEKRGQERRVKERRDIRVVGETALNN